MGNRSLNWGIVIEWISEVTGSMIVLLEYAGNSFLMFSISIFLNGSQGTWFHEVMAKCM